MMSYSPPWEGEEALVDLGNSSFAVCLALIAQDNGGDKCFIRHGHAHGPYHSHAHKATTWCD